MRSIRLTVVLAAAAACPSLAQEVTPNWFRNPALSPDGSTIVFTHGGDLYRVPAEGGTAWPITIDEAYESSPVWSRDGRWIAFASDRSGNADVYIMPASGGEATRLTYHSADDTPTDFSPDGSAVIFESSRLDDVESALFPSGVLAELYRVPVTGGTPEMVLTTPALRARFDEGGSRLLYEDRKGYENALRKHHTSSIARDVWVTDLGRGTHTKLTDFDGEDRDPHWAGDELVFLSERGGDFNVYRMPVRAGGAAEPLTSFEHHPVRDLHRGRTGDMVFSWHGDIYRMTDGAAASPVPISIGASARGGGIERHIERSGATEFAVAPSGKEVAFIVRGEVFVTSTEFATTRRITSTPGQERDVDFAPDGRSIVYAGERDGSWNVYEASIAHEDELYFFSSTEIQERALLETEAEEFQPSYSPDGESLAYLHNRTTLRVLDIESGDIKTVASGDTFYSYSDGDHWYEWSPNGEYIALHFYNRGRVFVSEVGIVNVQNPSDRPIDLTRSGYDDSRPHWAMDGGLIVWATDRQGERSHGSWGSEYDIYGVFLNQETYDRFRMTKEEFELQKELEEKRKKEEEGEEDEDSEASEDDEAESGNDDGTEEGDSDDEVDEAETDDDEPLQIDLTGLESRTVRLTIHSADIGDFVMSHDGDKLYYLAAFEKGYDLWVHEFREETTKIFQKLGADSASMELSAEGDAIFLLADGSLSKIDTKGGEKKPIQFTAEAALDAGEERQRIFDHVWRQTRQKFYREDMHGVDWAFYREQYEPKLAGITNNRDFAELLSELLGELNASHTGASYRGGGGGAADRTASLGVFYDNEHQGPGVRIAEIMEGGPLDRADLEIEEGMILTHIDGVELGDGVNLYEQLNRKAGERVRLRFSGAEGEPIDQVVRPIGLGEESQLRYERWVRQREQIVDRLSNGRLGYAHVRGMNDASFRQFYSDVMGEHFEKQGLIVDTRFNGGGWLHDDLVTFLTGKPYVSMYPRNIEHPEAEYFGEPATRWTKPSVVVMSESNYSDAHFFPWAYTELEIGPTVGTPVPGTATAVWWERLHTGDLVFGIPQVGMKGAAGTYLENDELQPTHEVLLDPESAAAGTDTQLEKAVEVLLQMVEN